MATSFPSTVLAVQMMSRRFSALSMPERSTSFPSAPSFRMTSELSRYRSSILLRARSRTTSS